jgi:hypothetical protein
MIISMESNPVSIWLIVGVLMLGPILLLAAAAGAFLWARSWRGRADKAAASTGAVAGQGQSLLSQLESARSEYAQVGSDAYTCMAEEFDRPIADLKGSLGVLAGLLNALDAIRQTPPAGGWEAVTSFWRTAGERRRLGFELESRQTALAVQMERARALWQNLENCPLETYARVQAAHENVDHLDRTLAELDGLGLAGLEDARAGLEQAQSALLEIPVAFTGSGPLPRATLFEMTSSVIELLDALEPPLAAWLREATGWAEQYQLGMGTFQRVLTNLTHLRAVISAAPPLLLDISSFIIHLSQLEDRLRAQFELFQSAGVQDLGRHVRAATRFENTLRSSSEEHDRACLEALDLERRQLELESKFTGCETSFNGESTPGSASSGDFLFDRDQSRDRLAAIDTRMDGLRPFTIKLPPGAISERINLVIELSGDLDRLGQDAKERRDRFDKLVGMLQSSDLQTGSDWIESARRDIKAAQDTSEEDRNKGWAWHSKADSLLRSLDGLEALQAHVAPTSLPVTIKESELPGRLEQARRLVDLHSKLRSQAAQVLRVKTPTPSK